MVGRTFHSQYIHFKGDLNALVLMLNHAAIEELYEWGKTPVPRWHSDHLCSQLSFIFINYGLRIVGFGTVWYTGPGFWRAFSRLGGIARVNLLLTVAKFDKDHNDCISDAELDTYQSTTRELISSVSSALGSLAVVFTLLIGGTHQNVVGRPIPWKPHDDFEVLYGEVAAEALLCTTYYVNLLVELLCIVGLLGCAYDVGRGEVCAVLELCGG